MDAHRDDPSLNVYRWDNSLVFLIRLKLLFRRGVICNKDHNEIAKRLSVSVATSKRHVAILIKKGLLKEDNVNYVCLRLTEKKNKFSTIRFTKRMTAQEIKDLLRAKVITENLHCQKFMIGLKEDIGKKGCRKAKFTRKEIKRIERRQKKYFGGKNRIPKTNERLVISDLTIAKWFNIARGTANRMKRRLYNLGILIYRKHLYQTSIHLPNLAERYSEVNGKEFFHRGYFYKSITEYVIPKTDTFGRSAQSLTVV